MAFKPGLSFYTNMPTPYQVDFFDALKNYFELHVVYFTLRESDRQWNLGTMGTGYRVTVLENTAIIKQVQRKLPSFHYSSQITNILRRDLSEYVIVNGTYWSPNVVKAISISHSRKKWVAYWSEPVFPVKSKIKFLIKKMMLSTVLNKTTCLLAIGQRAEDSFRSYGYTRPIHQVPYNINIALFSRASLDLHRLAELEKQQKANGEYVFLTSGSLIKRKGIDIVINAFKEAGSSANVRLLIVGDGPERSDLVKMANGDKRISFIGFQEKEMLPYWFNVADAFVFATRYDGWALVINEAVAAGKPVISSSAAGAVADQLNSENAFICEPDNIDQFAKAMSLLATQPDLNKKLAEKTKTISINLSSAFNARKVYDICTNSE